MNEPMRLLTDEEKMKGIYPNWLCTPKSINIWQTESEYAERKMVADKIAKAQLALDQQHEQTLITEISYFLIDYICLNRGVFKKKYNQTGYETNISQAFDRWQTLLKQEGIVE